MYSGGFSPGPLAWPSRAHPLHCQRTPFRSNFTRPAYDSSNPPSEPITCSLAFALRCSSHSPPSFACGASPPSTNTITIPSTYNFSGDWGTHTTSNSNTTLITGFTGALSASAGVVSGELTPYPAPLTPCITPTTTPIPVSGTVSADGNLALTLPLPAAPRPSAPRWAPTSIHSSAVPTRSSAATALCPRPRC